MLPVNCYLKKNAGIFQRASRFHMLAKPANFLEGSIFTQSASFLGSTKTCARSSINNRKLDKIKLHKIKFKAVFIHIV